jgi:Tol biopolymer transport system component
MRRKRAHVAFAAAAAVAMSLAGVATTAATASAAHHHGREGRVAFVRHDQIYTVRADGTGVHQLTAHGVNLHPKWSPNGHRIAFVHEKAGGATDVWVMRANGSAKTRVTHVRNATEPTWSPRGRYLAFGGGDNGVVLEKVRSHAPFGTPTVLMAYETNTLEGDDESPADAHPFNVDRFVAWSPDGTRIAVFNHDDGIVDDVIYMYNTATGEARQYADVGASCCGEADWSGPTWGPGSTFGYASVDYDDETGDPLPSRIVYPGYVGKPGDTDPAPDPAGTRIAVTNTARIYTQHVDGTHRQPLVFGSQPDWQHVG